MKLFNLMQTFLWHLKLACEIWIKCAWFTKYRILCLHCHNEYHPFVFSAWTKICSIASEHHFCPLCQSSEIDRRPAVGLFVCLSALLSITTTSFCNYKPQCTQAHHQVGPGPQAQPHHFSLQCGIFTPHMKAAGWWEAFCTSKSL